MNEDELIAGLPATSDDACYRAMDWLTEINADLERKVFDSLATLLDLEVDVLFFDTTSTYFVTDDEDDPVARDDHGMPLASGNAQRRGRGAGAGPVPDLGQVQGPPRRPAPGRDRHGRDEGRDPGPGLALARGHQPTRR